MNGRVIFVYQVEFFYRDVVVVFEELVGKYFIQDFYNIINKR